MEIFNFFPLRHHHMLQVSYALLIISCIPFAISDINDKHIVEDSREIIPFQKFGFLEDGHTLISIKDISWKSKAHKAQLNLNSMGFYIFKMSFLGPILKEAIRNKHSCVLSSKYVQVLSTFEKLTTNSSAYNVSTTVDEPDEYILSFVNCKADLFEVSMNVHTEMYNLKHGEKEFLSAGKTNLPILYFLLFLIYTSFFVIWVFTCIKQRPITEKIHTIMGALLLFKMLSMISAFEYYMYVRKTGTPHGWDIAFYVFGLFKSVLLFTVIVLIGTGWCFLKPHLQVREKKVLMVVMPLQVVENIAYVILREKGLTTKEWSFLCFTWKRTLLLVDVVCCCAIFFPIIWSMINLREASKTDGKAARNLEKLKLFKQFYMVLVGYLYFTRVAVPEINYRLNYRYEWVGNATEECVSLAFYVFIFYNFKPIERNPYLVIDEEEEKAAGQFLEDGTLI
ncbi:hypothetical protein CMV_030540 [Castanea mollissima]|uniref:Lung seven transmembrane receptor n=1 Tax=Castanea mollissima TaxID=60419 RepID=A0A8J4Q0X7_9ROSI|nr:hypothetical protein CMV_030540 [Castanea mollissima]